MDSLIMFLADASSNITSGAGKACGGFCNTNTINVVFGNAANTLTFIVGAVSVIMVIIGGLRYTISNGDSKAVGDAKNTILYALIGVGVSVAAYAVIRFVSGAIGS